MPKKKPKRQPLTVRRRRAVVRKLKYGNATAPAPYVSAIKADGSRAALVNVMVQTDAFQAACQMAAAAGNQSPDLTDRATREQWLEAIKDSDWIIQDGGMVAHAKRRDTDKLGVEWGEQVEYLIHEDMRRYRAWTRGEVYELTLEDGRHCRTCKRTHYPSKARVGLFYGKDRDVSGLNAAVPDGYPVVTLREKVK